MKSTKHLKRMLLLQAVLYVLSVAYLYATGQKRMFYLGLAPIPLLFLGWGLSRLLAGGVIRDIAKNLTEEERAESNRLAQSYGGTIGIVAAVPFAILCAMLYMLWGVTNFLPYVILFCIVMVLASPLMFRQWKTMRTFMLSTEYAKKQGHNKGSANKALNRTSESRARRHSESG